MERARLGSEEGQFVRNFSEIRPNTLIHLRPTSEVGKRVLTFIHTMEIVSTILAGAAASGLLDSRL